MAIQSRRTNLLRRIQRFRDAQSTYMPGLRAYLDSPNSPKEPDSTLPESMSLHLPSSLPLPLQSCAIVAGLIAAELTLQTAQALDALDELRRQLRTRTFTHNFKVAHLRGQIAQTRATALYAQVDTRIRACRHRYTRARTAILGLCGPGPWEDSLRVLKHEDIRGVGERLRSQTEKVIDAVARARANLPEPGDEDLVEVRDGGIVSVSDGSSTVSWIWIANGLDGSKEINDGLHIEWAKARARSRRWHEELLLLEEEMRRCLQYCVWRADWWDWQATRHRDISDVLAEGLSAYASEQAATERAMEALWREGWAASRERGLEITTQAVGSAITSSPAEIEMSFDYEDEGFYEFNIPGAGVTAMVQEIDVGC